MGIFKNITRTLKQAAPVIGSAIGMYLGGPAGAAIGSGIGSLAAGRDAEEALKAAALAGGTAYLSGYGKGFKKMPSDATADARFFGGSEVTDSPTVTAIQKAQTPSSFFDKAIDFAKSGPGIATLGGLGTLALLGGEEEKKTTGSDMPDYPVGKTRLGYGRIGDKFYNLDDEEERKQYFEDRRKNNKDDEEVVNKAMGGMQVNPALQGFGSQISNTIGKPIQEKIKEVPAFLNEVETMAEQRFGIELENQDSSFNSLQDFFDQYRDGLGFEKTDMEQREPMFENQLQREPMIERNFYNRFQSGIAAQPFGSFGGGGSRLAGMGAIGSLFMNNGGEVNGPGTGTSDSVPARLSDGEFVLTAKAVRGAGGGDRDLGAARMYDMMSSLERVA